MSTRSQTRAYRVIVVVSTGLMATAALGQTVNVGTALTATASYSGVSQTAGPFPWSDLGVTATASVAPGNLSLSTGGSTAFTLNTSVSAGEQLYSGTSFNVGYTPGWTGSMSAAAATGNVSSNLVYDIGPISGSANLLNVPVSAGGSSSADLAASLNAGNGSTTASSASGSGPGAGVGYTLSAQACFIACATVASATLGINIGTQVQQTITATPTVTYGDLVWVSTTDKYSASAPQAFIAGSAGNVANILGGGIGSGLGLSNGQTFYYNVLPEVQIDMPVTNQAQLSLPASITASYQILGVGGSQSFPLGNLYTLDTGAASFDVNATFNNGGYYSIGMQYDACAPNLAVCAGPVATVLPTYTPQVLHLGGGQVPPDAGACGTTFIGCNLSVNTGSGSIGGYGTQNEGPLFPGDTTGAPVCGQVGTPYAGQCINQVTLSGGPLSAPELDPASLEGELTLLLGVLVVIRARHGRRESQGSAALSCVCREEHQVR